MSDGSAAGSIRVICGPTAAGKSAIALRLARIHGAAIIGADSRQIYRGLDIGTAKPGRDEQEAVPHHCIDIIEPTERFSAAAWAECAERAIEHATAAGRAPLIVGGTGFYLRALFQPLFQEPPLEVHGRQSLRNVLDSMTTAELRRWCSELDPSRAGLGRAQLSRAIEVALLTGRRLSALHGSEARRPRFQPRYLVVDPGSTLAQRIERRTREMLDAGWEDEVRRLDAWLPAEAPAWNSTGYRTIRELVRGGLDRATAIGRVVIETRQYAKRQRTWFRHQLDEARTTRIVPGEPAEEAELERWWLGGEW